MDLELCKKLTARSMSEARRAGMVLELRGEDKLELLDLIERLQEKVLNLERVVLGAGDSTKKEEG